MRSCWRTQSQQFNGHSVFEANCKGELGLKRSYKALPKAKLAPKKVMVTLWWSASGLIHYRFLNPSEIITFERYAQQINEVKWNEVKVAQSCQTLCNPMDCSLPGPYVHGILQARILVKVKMLSNVWLLATPWTAAHQAPPSMDFPGKSSGVVAIAIPFSRGSSQPRDWSWVFCTAGRFFIVWATREVPANQCEASKTAMPAASIVQQKGPNSSSG